MQPQQHTGRAEGNEGLRMSDHVIVEGGLGNESDQVGQEVVGDDRAGVPFEDLQQHPFPLLGEGGVWKVVGVFGRL